MTKRKSFTPEFKADAASLVVEKGYTIREACQAIGVGETAMRRWVEQLQKERKGLTPKAKAMTADQRRIQELEARIKRLELEKEILKKASALLMSETQKPLR